jgi:hypothetical protein
MPSFELEFRVFCAACRTEIVTETKQRMSSRLVSATCEVHVVPCGHCIDSAIAAALKTTTEQP